MKDKKIIVVKTDTPEKEIARMNVEMLLLQAGINPMRYGASRSLDEILKELDRKWDNIETSLQIRIEKLFNYLLEVDATCPVCEDTI